MKLNLKNITLVSVAGVRAAQSYNALVHSAKEIEFHSIKLITPENITADGIEIIKINPIDYEHYNKFIAYDLYKYIDSEFALIVQDDGYVANPISWRDEFLNYDYIGAPWALPHDDFSYRDLQGNLVRVGNGGFSLRSKKILKLASELNLVWEKFHGFYNEDGFFTCKNRHIYEEHGCKFAPLEVAKYFSHEVKIPEIEGIVPFGFHGIGSPYNVLSNNK